MPARQKPLAAAMQTLTMSDSARNVSPLAQLVRGPASAAHTRVALQLRVEPVLQARGALSRCAQLLGVILHDHERGGSGLFGHRRSQQSVADVAAS